MTTGERIKLRRELKCMSQDRLAELMGLKGKSSISKIESSGDNVSLKTVKRVAAALNCDYAELLGWLEDATPQEKEERERATRLIRYNNVISNISPSDAEILRKINYLSEEARGRILNQLEYEYKEERKKRKATSA